MICEINGKTVHAATGGLDPFAPEASADPAVVLVHGAGMDSSVWSLQTRWLGHRGMRVVAVDLPGHGRSEGEALSSISDAADWLGQFLDTTGLCPAVVVGHSMGTFIALELAARRPELVEALALFGTSTAMGVHPELLDAASNDLSRAAALMASWGHDPSARLRNNPTPGLSMTGGAIALVEMSRPGILANDLSACATYDQAKPTAAKVSCPTTVVSGTSDKMTPAKAAAKLYNELSHLDDESRQTITLPNVGHMMMTEDPQSVRNIIRQVATGRDS